MEVRSRGRRSGNIGPRERIGRGEDDLGTDSSLGQRQRDWQAVRDLMDVVMMKGNPIRVAMRRRAARKTVLRTRRHRTVL